MLKIIEMRSFRIKVLSTRKVHFVCGVPIRYVGFHSPSEELAVPNMYVLFRFSSLPTLTRLPTTFTNSLRRLKLILCGCMKNFEWPGQIIHNELTWLASLCGLLRTLLLLDTII